MASLEALLGYEIDGFITGAAIWIVVLVLAMFGVTLMISSYHKAGRPDLPRWHPRRWIAPSLEFYYGLLIIQFDVVVWGYLGLLVIHSGKSIPLWFGASSVTAAVLASLAFKHFAQDRRAI